jgi:hypothetical protein
MNARQCVVILILWLTSSTFDAALSKPVQWLYASRCLYSGGAAFSPILTYA